MDQFNDRLMRRALRKYYGAAGWILLVYYLIMNAAVLFDQFFEIAVVILRCAFHHNASGILDAFSEIEGRAWGYFLAAAGGLLILILWKKPIFWKEKIWEKGRRMTFGSFFCLTALFLSAQLLYEIFSMLLETGLNALGYSILDGFSDLTGDMNDLGMFLYGGVLAPVTEEILFRGLIQKTLQPHGKRFAILGSAFTFGMFHGNILQTPYAFLCGLVLGYVAAEYSIGWSMLLHMINNLVIADMLTRVTSVLSFELGNATIFGIILFFSIVAVIVLIIYRREISRYFQVERLNPVCTGCFFSSAGIVTFTVIMVINIVASFFIMLTRI